MKILIADDQMGRYDRLFKALNILGVAREQIDLVAGAKPAREHLEKNNYDLLLLDILLPLWPESIADSTQHSLDLLFELHESDSLRKPGRILGITGDKDVANEAAPNFNKLTWSVVEYSESNDEWVNKVANCVYYILSESSKGIKEKPEYGIDLAIICALEKPELSEVLKLPWGWSAARPLDDNTFVHDGNFQVGDRTITVAATFSPRMGMVSAALRSATLISLLRPRLIAMCGICAGVRSKVKMGDVLLADPAWDFQSGKRVIDQQNASFSIAPHQIAVNSVLRSHVEQIRSDQAALMEIAQQYQDEAPGVPSIHIGPVASGSAVLADGEVINEIKAQHRDLIGVEMEVYGVYAAASAASQPQPKAFALKSVCDFADPDKGDDVQRYAAYTSANVLRHLMERFGPRLLD